MDAVFFFFLSTFAGGHWNLKPAACRQSVIFFYISLVSGLFFCGLSPVADFVYWLAGICFIPLVVFTQSTFARSESVFLHPP